MRTTHALALVTLTILASPLASAWFFEDPGVGNGQGSGGGANEFLPSTYHAEDLFVAADNPFEVCTLEPTANATVEVSVRGTYENGSFTGDAGHAWVTGSPSSNWPTTEGGFRVGFRGPLVRAFTSWRNPFAVLPYRSDHAYRVNMPASLVPALVCFVVEDTDYTDNSGTEQVLQVHVGWELTPAVSFPEVPDPPVLSTDGLFATDSFPVPATGSDYYGHLVIPDGMPVLVTVSGVTEFMDYGYTWDAAWEAKGLYETHPALVGMPHYVGAGVGAANNRLVPVGQGLYSNFFRSGNLDHTTRVQPYTDTHTYTYHAVGYGMRPMFMFFDPWFGDNAGALLVTIQPA